MVFGDHRTPADGIQQDVSASLDRLRGLELVNTQPLWCTCYLHAIVIQSENHAVI